MSTATPHVPRPPWRRYGVAAASVVLGWLVREALTPGIGPTALPFITFFPAVAWATWYGGMGPALLSVVLAALAANWFFIPPLDSLHMDDPLGFVAFPVAAGLIVAAIELMHRARGELTQARDMLATTMHSIGDAVVVTDASGHVTFLNPEAERLTGWRAEQAQGRPLGEVFRIVNEATRQPVDSPVDKVLREGVVVGLANHTLLIARDGTRTPIDDSAAPVRQPGEAVQGVVLVFRDVRQQRLAEAARTRLAAIVESSGDAILSKDLDGVVLTWNTAAERLFGWRAEEIVGRSIRTLIPPEHQDEEDAILARLRSGQGSELMETTRLTRDGRRIPVSIRVSPLRTAEGAVIGASKTVRDLSEQVASREALAREKELLATTLASIGDAVIATDAEGRVTFLNPVAAALTGWSQEAAAGEPLTTVFRIVNESTRAEVENPALRAMREGVVVGLANHTVLLGRSGKERPIDDSAAPIRDLHGKVVGSVLVFRDVTARRRIDAERERLRAELAANLVALREVDQRKNEFLATLAHELRNPLAPIKNSITLLQLRGPQDPELRAARDVIDRQVQHLARMLDDLLDVNRLGRQKLQLRKERVTLESVLAVAMETARPVIEGKGHRTSLAVPDVALDADPVRLAQVFANLLNNAAKYMDAGGEIRVSAVREGQQVIVSVADQGMGLDAESLPRLFEMFAQAPLALERAQGGAGIGLALAKGLVELHGGTITARSEGQGKGSTFVVRLPIAAGTAPTAAPSTPPLRRGPPRRILIADDARDNTETLARMLGMLGHEVHIAYDGLEAVATAERIRPEVALLDIAMPGVNGYEACRRIREQAAGRQVYLIAQTGLGQEDDLRRAARAGFDRHMLKPVDCSVLADVLANLPGRPAP